MGFHQPPGRITVNSGVGNFKKVDESKWREFSFMGDDEIHTIEFKDRTVEVNGFKKLAEKLERIKF